MKNAVRWLLGCAAAAVIVVAALGAMMSPRYVVARSLRLPNAQNEVFDLLADPGTYAAWRSDLARVEILGAMDGKKHFVETAKTGAAAEFVFEPVAPTDAARTIVLRTVGDRLPTTLERTIEIDAVEGLAGSIVRITDRGEVPNVFLRLWRIALHSPAQPIEDLLDDVARRFGAPTEH